MTSKNKRILFIVTQSEMGGAQRFLHSFLTRTSDKYEVLVATGNDGDKELTSKLKNLGIETRELKNLKREINPAKDLKACFEIKKLIENFRPDVLFLLSSKAGFLGSLVPKYLVRNTGCKIIYRIGGWSFNDPGPAWKKKLWTIIERRSASWKDTIIVNSTHDLNQAKELAIKPRRELVLVHNGLDLNKIEFLPGDEARVRLYEKVARISGKVFPAPEGRGSTNEIGRQTKTIIGIVSNLYTTKGIDILIETAEYFKNSEGIIFVVFGDGPERKNLESRIKNLGLEKKVFLLGRIPDAQKMMKAFDIFILPSLKEGFPWALIEAMAAKLPVIATRVGAVPEIIDNGKNGFIAEPGNPASLADKIKTLLADDHLRQEFSIQSHQTVLFKFSEDKMIKETEELL